MTGAWLHIRSSKVNRQTTFAESETCSRAETNIHVVHILLVKVYVHTQTYIHTYMTTAGYKGTKTV